MNSKTGTWHGGPTRVAAGLGLGLALVLAGCGGGRDSEAGEPVLPAAQSAGVQAPPQRTTLAEYAVAREQRGTVLGFPSPSAAELESIHRRSVDLGIAQLTPGLLGGGNALVLPPLVSSFVNTVGAAAQGTTLAELRSHHPEPGGFYASMVQTQGVTRSLWAPAGTPLLGSFLMATDRLGPLPPLAAWSGTEVTQRDDARLDAALDGFDGDALFALGLGAETRLLVIDRLQERVGFDAAKPLDDGVFLDASGTRRVLPMLRLGAIRHRGADHVAHIATTPQGRHVVTIQPDAGDLRAFGSQRLAAVLSELARMSRQQTLVALPAGTMVLPVLDNLALPGPSIPVQGVQPAASEVNADLRGLDGGGTYLRMAQLANHLSIGVAGLAAQGGHAAAFTYSPLNAWGDGTAGAVFVRTPDPVFVVDGPPEACPRAEPDLRSLFIAVFDDDLRLVSLAAIGVLEGRACQ